MPLRDSARCCLALHTAAAQGATIWRPAVCPTTAHARWTRCKGEEALNPAVEMYAMQAHGAVAGVGYIGAVDLCLNLPAMHASIRRKVAQQRLLCTRSGVGKHGCLDPLSTFGATAHAYVARAKGLSEM